MNGDGTPAVAAILQTAAVAGAVVVKPSAREHSSGPCPPAEESWAALEAAGIVERVGPPRPGEGKPFQYRALFRGRTGPHDDGRVE